MGKKILIMLTMMLMFTSVNMGESLAAEARTDPDNDGFSFYLNLPEYGVTDLATAREKTDTNAYAQFRLTTITNNSTVKNQGLYINVRSENGSTIAGTAHKIANGTKAPASFHVAYKSGFGKMRKKYRPSGQTDNDSKENGYVKGRWIP